MPMNVTVEISADGQSLSLTGDGTLAPGRYLIVVDEDGTVVEFEVIKARPAPSVTVASVKA